MSFLSPRNISLCLVALLSFSALPQAHSQRLGSVRGFRRPTTWDHRDLKNDDKNNKDNDNKNNASGNNNGNGNGNEEGEQSLVTERYGCVDHQTAFNYIQMYPADLVEPASDPDCLAEGDPDSCAGGCCRMGYSLFCDTDNEWASFPCVCNRNTKVITQTPTTAAPTVATAAPTVVTAAPTMNPKTPPTGSPVTPLGTTTTEEPLTDFGSVPSNTTMGGGNTTDAPSESPTGDLVEAEEDPDMSMFP